MNDGEQRAHFEGLLQKIGELSNRQIGEVAFAVMKRYGELFPEEEIVFLSLPKDAPDERIRILKQAYALEQENK